MKSVIVGAGYYGEVLKSYLIEVGIDVIGFLDDTPELQNKRIQGLPVLGKTSLIERIKDEYDVSALYCSLGNNVARLHFLKKARAFGLKTPSFIYPTSIISPDAKILGTLYLLPGSIIQPYAVIGDGCLLLLNVTIGHHTVIGESCFVSTHSAVGAKMNLEKYTWIGMGATVMTGVKNIGKNSLIGAGAVVINDILENEVVAGTPAKRIKTQRLFEMK